MTANDTIRQCEVPSCPDTAANGLRVCEKHFREPATPKDHAEALAYLRDRLARYDRHWIEPDRADSLELHGSSTSRRSGSFSRQARRRGPGDIGPGLRAVTVLPTQPQPELADYCQWRAAGRCARPQWRRSIVVVRAGARS